MDLTIQGNQKQFLELLALLGFKIKQHRSYCEAKLQHHQGRLHLLVTEVSPGEIYVDLHFDKTLHFLKFRVDYARRPREFYERVLSEKLRATGFRSKVLGGFEWSARQNRAIVSGIRLKSQSGVASDSSSRKAVE